MPRRLHITVPSVLRTRCRALLASLLIASGLGAVTLEELRHDTNLTPERFARYFSNFEYVFHPEPQPSEVFLETRKGDCDDFAMLADIVLREKGYHTKLVTVRMPGLTHVICYVQDTKSYLDFNNRVYLRRTVSVDDSLTDIAHKVAKSFDASWTSVSEFTYHDGVKQMVRTISKTGGSASDHLTEISSSTATNKPARHIVIDF